MSAPTYPPVLREPIAADAAGANITNPMPESPTGTNAASIEGGFPPVTMTSELAGGKPPLGQDMNGFLFLLSSHLVYLQSGSPYLFDTDVSTALGGYPLGAILGMADGSGVWISIAANNTNNPDTTGIFWRPVYSSGPAIVSTTGGVSTLTPTQWKKSVIVIQGTLIANAQIVFPGNDQEWLVVNNTSGPFTVSVTAGGSGVTIPQGGFSAPTGVYYIGDGNLYPTVAPLGIPIDQAATPLTIAERTNAGWLLATAFNSSIAQDDLAITSIWYEAAADGFIRKMSLASLESQMTLGLINGVLVNSQVPYAVVQQWASTFFLNAALTGVSTATTAGVGTATSQIATTAFVNPGSGVTANGSYRKNPDGSIDQWGSFAFTANGGTVARSFPIAFPNAVESVVIGTPVATAGLGGAGSYQASQPASPTLSGFQYHSIASSNTAIVVHWEAKGR